MGKKEGAAAGKNCIESPQKIKERITITSSNSRSDYNPKGSECRDVNRYL